MNENASSCLLSFDPAATLELSQLPPIPPLSQLRTPSRPTTRTAPQSPSTPLAPPAPMPSTPRTVTKAPSSRAQPRTPTQRLTSDALEAFTRSQKTTRVLPFTDGDYDREKEVEKLEGVQMWAKKTTKDLADDEVDGEVDVIDEVVNQREIREREREKRKEDMKELLERAKRIVKSPSKERERKKEGEGPRMMRSLKAPAAVTGTKATSIGGIRAPTSKEKEREQAENIISSKLPSRPSSSISGSSTTLSRKNSLQRPTSIEPTISSSSATSITSSVTGSAKRVRSNSTVAAARAEKETSDGMKKQRSSVLESHVTRDSLKEREGMISRLSSLKTRNPTSASTTTSTSGISKLPSSRTSGSTIGSGGMKLPNLGAGTTTAKRSSAEIPTSTSISKPLPSTSSSVRLNLPSSSSLKAPSIPNSISSSNPSRANSTNTQEFGLGSFGVSKLVSMKSRSLNAGGVGSRIGVPRSRIGMGLGLARDRNGEN